MLECGSGWQWMSSSNKVQQDRFLRYHQWQSLGVYSPCLQLFCFCGKFDSFSLQVKSASVSTAITIYKITSHSHWILESRNFFFNLQFVILRGRESNYLWETRSFIQSREYFLPWRGVKGCGPRRYSKRCGAWTLEFTAAPHKFISYRDGYGIGFQCDPFICYPILVSSFARSVQLRKEV